MKNKWKSIGIIGVLFGTILSRWASSQHGENSTRLLVISIIVIILLGAIVLACITKKYLGVLMLFTLFIPIIIGLIGVYLTNIYMMVGGLAAFFILGGVMTKKVLPWMRENGRFKK